MKALISPIGKRDPRGSGGSYGAALSTALAIRPDVVFLLPTLDRVNVGAEHTMEEASATAAELGRLLPGVRAYIRPFDLTDPTDYAQLLPETERLLTAIRAELGDDPDLEFVINASSGTPQMQASLILAVSSGLIAATVLQSRDPRFVPPGEEQVREVATRYWSEAFARSRAWRLFEQGEFEACAIDLEFLRETRQSRRRAAATNLRALCRLYAAHHHIDYRGASDIVLTLREAVDGVVDYTAAWPALAAQSAMLERLPKVHPRDLTAHERCDETPEFLADIVHNATRCCTRQAYADCLARVWRVLEGTLYLRLRQRHGVEPTDVRTSRNQDLAEKVIQFMRSDSDRPVEITLGSGERVLGECLKDTAYQELLRLAFPGTPLRVGKVMEALRQTRNKSVAGHNALPVAAESAERGLTLARLALQALAPEADLDGHPFAAPVIARVGRVFFDALRG